jgi:hypothetical protein
VRLCDGYFFPISFATSEGQFERDEQACARSCSAPTKLFVYRNPGQEPEQMVDLDGRPYAKLPTAFQFRTRFDQSCKCNPHPWEQEAVARHRRYAEVDAKKKSQRQATIEVAPPITRKQSTAAARPGGIPNKAADVRVAAVTPAEAKAQGPMVAEASTAIVVSAPQQVAVLNPGPGSAADFSMIAGLGAASLLPPTNEPTRPASTLPNKAASQPSAAKPVAVQRTTVAAVTERAAAKPVAASGPVMRLGATAGPARQIPTSARSETAWRERAFAAR